MQLFPSSHSGAHIPRPPILRWLAAEGLGWLLVAALLALVDYATAISVLFGAAAVILPNAYFARLAFRYSGARVAQRTVRAFYWGELGKLLLTACILVAAYTQVESLSLVALFLAYSIATILHWVVTARCLVRR